ncbi:MAG: hypothetical protein PHX68_03980 [Alphaproteobacteria bacterium]|nr:hypothetical protein [Alphaproteobacteria bacterium]
MGVKLNFSAFIQKPVVGFSCGVEYNNNFPAPTNRPPALSPAKPAPRLGKVDGR